MKDTLVSSMSASWEQDILRVFSGQFPKLHVCMQLACTSLFVYGICVCSPSWHPTEGPCGMARLCTHCREQAEEGECVWACPLHRHTAGVCSQPSRTRERHTVTGRERERVRREQYGWCIEGVAVCICLFAGYRAWGVFVCILSGVQYVTICQLRQQRWTELKMKSCNGSTKRDTALCISPCHW